MWRRVGLVKTDVSEQRVASIFYVEETLFLVRDISSNLKMDATISSETTFTRSTCCHIPEDGMKTSNPTISLHG
jgi:hypothetical protein